MPLYTIKTTPDDLTQTYGRFAEPETEWGMWLHQDTQGEVETHTVNIRLAQAPAFERTLNDDRTVISFEAQHLSWEDAVKLLGGLIDVPDDEYEMRRQDAVDTIVEALPEYHAPSGSECEQEDWVKEGSWDGDETLEQIAAEWDEYQKG